MRAQNAIPGVFSTSNGTVGPEGVGLAKAMDGYTKWMVNVLIPGYCAQFGYWAGSGDLGCFDTYNTSSPLFTDDSLSNTVDRQWQWLLCNEP